MTLALKVPDRSFPLCITLLGLPINTLIYTLKSYQLLHPQSFWLSVGLKMHKLFSCTKLSVMGNGTQRSSVDFSSTAGTSQARPTFIILDFLHVNLELLFQLAFILLQFFQQLFEILKDRNDTCNQVKLLHSANRAKACVHCSQTLCFNRANIKPANGSWHSLY